MARRMAVIPEELVESYFSKTSDTGLNDIENQIQNLLQESNYSDDAKAKLLSQLLLKHQRILNEPKPPLRVSIADSNQQMQDAPKNEEADLILRDIILSVSANFQKFVSPNVEKLNTRNYSWNEYGELMRDKEIIKNTNVSDLFSYLMRNVKKGYEPQGFPVFWRGIKEIKIPTRWIGNQKLAQNLELDADVDENQMDLKTVKQSTAPTRKKRKETRKRKWKNY
ncbi:uncharacterized protein TNCV_1719771 [Trichonephila clavipes]|nr:uncharacterized protein TNCV_1719771 [Trichonephila clavipes]